MWNINCNIIVATYLSFLISFVNSLCPAPEKNPTCFTAQQLKNEINRFIPIVNEMEALALTNSNLTGYTNDESMAGFHHFHTSHHVSDANMKDQKVALAVSLAKQSLFKKLTLTKSQFKTCLLRIGPSVNIAHLCSVKEANCNFATTTYYRTDGKCCNPNDPFMCAVDEPTIRLLQNSFIDGIDDEHPAIKSVPARKMTTKIQTIRGQHFDQRNIHNDFSTFFGQIFTHELMKTAKSQFFRNIGGFNCCNQKKDPFLDDLISKNPFCRPIDLDKKDSFFGPQGQTCMNYIRNLKVLKNCQVQSEGNAINLHTPVFDFELLYNDFTLPHLKANKGKFDLNHDVMDEMLTGYDERTHQMPGLMLICHMFANFHNFVFDKLREVLSVTNETLSIEARRITTAVFQKSIVDYTVSILPMDSFGIDENCFDPTSSPQISLEFNGAFRFLHVFLKEKMAVFPESIFKTDNKLKKQIPDEFDFEVFVENMTWFRDNTCGLLHGLLDRSWNLGSLGPQILNSFFRAQGAPSGLDLRSTDYQHAKENGEPSYCDALRIIHNSTKSCNEEITWDDYKFHDPSAKKIIRDLFTNPCDVPLSFAADLEKREFDPLGITNSLIIAEQVMRSVCADRFFFTNAPFFKKQHRIKINRITIRDVLCLYMNTHLKCGTQLQLNCFHSHGSDNLKRPCVISDIVTNLDLKNWIPTV